MSVKELLKEEKLPKGSTTWMADQWIEFYSQDGVMTLDEFRQLNKAIIDKMFPKEI